MKFKLTKYILGVLMATFVLTGCSKNNDELASTLLTKPTIGYEVIDGTVKFASYSTYEDVNDKMSKMSYSELESWRSALKITSLYDSYINQVVPLDSTKTEKRVGDKVFAMLLNDKGILIIGDTIIKVIDEYAYKIPTKDVSKLDILQSNPENWTDLGIGRIKHTNYFVENKVDVQNPVGMQKFTGAKDQDGEIYDFQPGKYRRQEKVIMSAFSTNSVNPNGLSKIGASLKGVARNKDVVWGTWWGSWFSDEIYYGKITINSGQYVAGTATFDMAPASHVIAANATYDDLFLLALYWNDNVKTMNVTYVYQKNSGSPRITKNIVWN